MANAPVAYIDSGKPGNPAYNTCRQVLTLNGVDQLVRTDRIAGIDLDNLDVELEGFFDLTGAGTLWAQNISSSASSKEFQIFTNSSDGITLILGGTSTKITIGSAVKQDAALWAVRINGTSTTIYKNGAEVGSGTTAIGANREPTANFKIGARSAGTDTTYGFFLGGSLRNQKVWTGGDRSTGLLSLSMRINDGFAANPDISNDAGTDGTGINLTSAAWSEVCE